MNVEPKLNERMNVVMNMVKKILPESQRPYLYQSSSTRTEALVATMSMLLGHKAQCNRKTTVAK